MPSDRRSRRPAEEARRAILDAAERRVAELGPEGLRLQQIAADVGVSHPAILHHFGSREGLVREVARRTAERLQGDLVTMLAGEGFEPGTTAAEMIDRAFHTFSHGGHARVMAWMMLSGQELGEEESYVHGISQLAHEKRVEVAKAQGATPPPFEDTLFRTLLVALCLFGDAIAGDPMRRSAGLGEDPEAAPRFRAWLARLIATTDAV